MLNGLTDTEVKERIKKGLCNYDVKIESKSIKTIILKNTITLFNILNLCLGLAIFLVDSYKNLLFLGVVFFNTILGIIDEIKAKKILDKLKILVNNHTMVIRNGVSKNIDANNIVVDDIVKLKPGQQILVDLICLQGNILVDESLITGESTPILKNKGEEIKAGSFLISGNGLSKVIRVGKDCYTSKIYKTASKINSNNSLTLNALKKIIKFISIIIIPIGLILFYTQYQVNHNLKYSVISTCAALLGMIPDGLVLLTSTVFIISAIKMSKKNILVQDLNCIDSLASIDTFCFDKTGTLTNNDMEVKKVICLDKKYNIDEIVANYANCSDDNNETMLAIKKYYKEYNCNYQKQFEIPFNSINKYSLISFKNKGTFLIGAKEFLCDIDIKEYESQYRVLVICRYNSNKKPIDKNDIQAIGLILLNDTLKKNVKEVIQQLIKRDINIVLISGDSLPFLNNIAKRLELNEVKTIDISKLDYINYDEIAFKYNIFARVTPEEKLNIIKALKKKHRVAMMGDGVNDILALKEADASVSFINAKESARNVSKIILLNNDFSNINIMIDEGAKTMNNLCRSATLFINKTIYSSLLAILFVFVNFKYPFQPIQLTLNNFVLIGMPSFILSFLPNKIKLKNNFLKNILKHSIPSALIIFLNILIVLISNNFYNITNYTSTICMFLVAFNGFLLIYKICKPLNVLTLILIASLLFIYLIAILFFHNLFEFVYLPFRIMIFIGIIVLIDVCIFNILYNFLEKRIK